MPEHGSPFEGEFPNDLEMEQSPVFDAETDPTSTAENPICMGSETSVNRLELDLPVENVPGVRPGIETAPMVLPSQEANEWRFRAAKVQATALTASMGTCLLWMATNVYAVRESFNPGSETSYFSVGFHNVTSVGMMICGVIMTCTSAAAATYRSRAWTIEQQIAEAAETPKLAGLTS